MLAGLVASEISSEGILVDQQLVDNLTRQVLGWFNFHEVKVSFHGV